MMQTHGAGAMKMLVLVTDSEYERTCISTLRDEGVEGYTIIPQVFGVGRTGAKMGDRVHPGVSAMVIAVVPEERAGALMACIRACIADGRLCASTHAWTVPVELAVEATG